MTLNYDKADLWSLGVVLATMSSTHEQLLKYGSVVDGRKQLIAAALAICVTRESSAMSITSLRLIHHTVAVSPTERWSCQYVYTTATATAIPGSRLTAIHHTPTSSLLVS